MSGVDNNEEALQRAPEGLEVKVRERTADLSRSIEQLQKEVVERRRAEEALRDSEERFKAFMDNSPAVAFIKDGEGRFIYINRPFKRFFNVEPDDFIGKTDFELWPEETAAQLRENDRAVLQSGQTAELVEMVPAPDGALHSWLTFKFPLGDKGGRLCLAGIAVDITERKQAEEQNRRLIHDLGERVKELTALHHAARILHDEEKAVPGLLEEIVSLIPPAWQYPEVTAARISFGEAEFKTPNYAPTRWSQEARFKVGSTEGTLEVVYLEERPEEDSGPFLSEERNLINSLAELIRSALDSRLAQEALRASEERFFKAFYSCPIALTLTRLEDGRLTEANESAQRLLGFSREELIGRTTVELGVWANPDDRRRFVEEFEQLGSVRYREVRLRRKQGDVVVVLLTLELMEVDGVKCGQAVLQDITERKLAEERLKRSNEELRALSARLHSVREEESARIAREIHDELGASLSSLKWDLEEIGEDIPESADASPLAALREKVAGMLTLTDNAINTVRRIASELRPTALEEFGFAEAVRWHAEQFQARTGIAVHCDCVVEGTELNRERATALFRIAQEALTNVLRHAQATKVEIRMIREAGYFVLTVSDNGKGITEREKSAPQSLGLLGMRERAHLLGGEINIESAAGRGTVVTVRVPVTG